MHSVKVEVVRDLEAPGIDPRILGIFREYLGYVGDGYCEFEEALLVCVISIPKVLGNGIPQVELFRVFIVVDPDVDKMYIYPEDGEAFLAGLGMERLERAGDYREALQELLNHLVGSYNAILTSIQDAIDKVEDMVESGDLGYVVKATYVLRRSLINTRRGLKNLVQMLREINSDQRKSSMVKSHHMLLELIDEALAGLEIVEIYRETIISLREAHASLLGLKLNDIVKRLTAITVVLMLPTLIASIYGMNFDTSYPLNMPELSWSFGYIYALLLMISSSMAGYFLLKVKGWF
ncbi:magnesium and cobalt transport protein CorA [Desulfurococcaceae archaeon AG1]|jgi:Mg2+ and Co2+ transporter CorA|nr:magnesium and cobalt transport protein CorA [Desulfurococcaceae archaeon AG1]